MLLIYSRQGIGQTVLWNLLVEGRTLEDVAEEFASVADWEEQAKTTLQAVMQGWIGHDLHVLLSRKHRHVVGRKTSRDSFPENRRNYQNIATSTDPIAFLDEGCEEALRTAGHPLD